MISAYLYKDGRSSLIGNDIFALSVTDSGDIYAVKPAKNYYGSLICINSGGDSRVISDTISSDAYVMVNYPGQNEIFFSDGEYICLSVDGGEKISMGKGGSFIAEPFFYSNYPAAQLIQPVEFEEWENQLMLAYLPYPNLSDMLLFINDGGSVSSIYIDSDYSPAAVAENTKAAIRTEDGLFYYCTASDSSLYSTDLQGIPHLIADDVQDFIVSNGELYYIDHDNILWYGSEDKIQLHDNAESICRLPSGKVYFITKKDDSGTSELFSLAGTEAEKIDDDVLYIYAEDSSLAYYKKSAYQPENTHYLWADLYMSYDSSDDFILLAEMTNFIAEDLADALLIIQFIIHNS